MMLSCSGIRMSWIIITFVIDSYTMAPNGYLLMSPQERFYRNRIGPRSQKFHIYTTVTYRLAFKCSTTGLLD